MKKLFALMLATLMLLSLCACGKSEAEYQSGMVATEPQEMLMPDEAGKLTIYSEADIQVVYNEKGNVIAVTALNQPAERIVNTYDFAEKTCSLAVLELVDMVFDESLLTTRSCILVRQEPGSATPSDDFLKNILDDAQLNKGEYPVIVTGADELNADGLFSAKTAQTVLNASHPATEGSTIVCSGDPVGGSYSFFCTDVEGNTKEYAVGAIDGTVTEIESSQETEQTEQEETEPIPESEIFDPIPDTEANAGADGGVDNGSINFD